MNVSEVFEKPNGPVTLDPLGHWWLTREDVQITNGNGVLTIVVGDGYRTARIQGTPHALRNLAAGIIAHVDSARRNAPARVVEGEKRREPPRCNCAREAFTDAIVHVAASCPFHGAEAAR